MIIFCYFTFLNLHYSLALMPMSYAIKRYRSGKPKPKAAARRGPGRNRLPNSLTVSSAPVQSSSYTTTRRVALGDLLGDGSGVFPNAYNYTASLVQLPNYGDFTNLFDQYRIDRVTMHFYPRASTVSDTNGFAAPGGVMLLNAAVDLDGASTPPTLNELLEYGSCQQHILSQHRSITWQPRIKSTQTGASGPLLPLGTWVDTSNPNMPYNGLRTYVGSTYSKYAECQVFAEMTVSFRQSK